MDTATATNGKKTGSTSEPGNGKEPMSVTKTIFEKVQRRYITLRSGLGTPAERDAFYKALEILDVLPLTCKCGSLTCSGTIHAIDTFCLALKELENLVDERDRLNVELDRIKRDRSSIIDRLKQIEKVLSDSKTRNQILETASVQHRQNHEQNKRERKELQSKLQERDQNLKDLQLEFEALRKEHEAVLAKAESATLLLAEQQRHIHELEESATAPSVDLERIAKLESELAVALEEWQKADSSRASMEAEVQELGERLTSTLDNNEADKLRAEVLHSRQQLASANDQIVQLKFELAKKESEATASQARMEQTTDDLDERLRQSSIVLNERIKFANTQRDQLAKRCADLQEELDKAKNSLRGELHSTRRDLNTAQNELRSLNAKYEALKGSVRRPSPDPDKLQLAETARNQAENKAQQIASKLEDLREAFEKTKANLLERNSAYDSLLRASLLQKNTPGQGDKESLERLAILEQQLQEAQDIRQGLQEDLAAERAKSLALAEERERLAVKLADERVPSSKASDSVFESRQVLQILEAYVQDLQKRLDAERNPQIHQEFCGLDPHEREQLKASIAIRENLGSDLSDLSAELYAQIGEYQDFCQNTRLKLRVGDVSETESISLKQELSSAEEEMKRLDEYLQNTVLRMTQANDEELRILHARLKIHHAVSDDRFQKIISQQPPQIPDPPDFEEDEALVDSCEPEVAVVDTSPDDQTYLVNALKRANELGLPIQEFLIISLFEMVPNSQKSTSYRKAVLSGNKSGILAYFETTISEMKKSWMKGKLQSRAMGKWLCFSGQLHKTNLYRRTSVELDWNLDEVMPPGAKERFVSAYGHYTSSSNKKDLKQ